MQLESSLLKYLPLAFRDREAGSSANRGKPTDDSVRSDRHAPGRNQVEREARARGGFRRRGGDRASRGLPKYAMLSTSPPSFYVIAPRSFSSSWQIQF